MEIIDRYLHAVRQYLPEQQDDIIRELSENIRSQQEEKESELGRPLSEPEMKAMLQQFGHPMLMAGRYLPQKHLIGPAVFPYYWFTLRGTLWLAAVLYVIAVCTTPFAAGIVAMTGGTSAPALQYTPRLGLIVGGGFALLLAVFGITTLVFSLLDLVEGRYHVIARWDPAKLPPVPRVPAEFLGKPVSRPKSISQIILGVVFAICWFAMPQFPLIAGPGTVVQVAPVWHTFRLVLLAVVGISVLGGIVGLLRPLWMRWVFPLVHASRIVGLFWLYSYARSGGLITAASVSHQGDPQMVVRMFNSGISYGLLLALCLTVLYSAVEIARSLAQHFRQGGTMSGMHLLEF